MYTTIRTLKPHASLLFCHKEYSDKYNFSIRIISVNNTKLLQCAVDIYYNNCMSSYLLQYLTVRCKILGSRHVLIIYSSAHLRQTLLRV